MISLVLEPVIERFYLITQLWQWLFVIHEYIKSICKNMMNINGSQQTVLLTILEQALHEVNGERCVESYLRKNPISGNIFLLAIGKAACSMAQGAQNVLADQIKKALVITGREY